MVQNVRLDHWSKDVDGQCRGGSRSPYGAFSDVDV
jgi:hypothetical protein